MEGVFLDILNNRSQDFLFEDDYLFSILDAFPVSPGHSLIVPKRQILNFVELNDQEWTSLKKAMEVVMTNVKSLNLIHKYSSLLKSLTSHTQDVLTSKKIFYVNAALNNLSKFKSVEITGFNIGLNDGRSAGRTINHLHWHIIPRYDGDVEMPQGGIRNIIPNLGNYI